MLFAIDIGNTNVVAGVFDREKLRGQVRLSTPPRLTIDECGLQLESALGRMGVDSRRVLSTVIASVVPSLTGIFETATAAMTGQPPLVVSHRVKLPIAIRINRPEQLGADRIANAVAGYTRFGGPIIVVDFGTATTFDVVDESGAYIGGVIIPGPETAMAELVRKAARLFEVRIERPDSVVGKSTAGALKSGLFYGTVGQVNHIIERIIYETGFRDCRVIATGGLAPGIEKASRRIVRVEPTLTLEGLRAISEANRD